MPKVQQLGQSLYILLPKSVAKLKGVSKGDEVDWREGFEGNLFLKKILREGD